MVDRTNPLVAASHVSAKSSSEGFIEKSTKTARHTLVIDDSVTIRKSIERALVKMGFAVGLAGNEMEGLKMLQKSLFDALLLGNYWNFGTCITAGCGTRHYGEQEEIRDNYTIMREMVLEGRYK